VSPTRIALLDPLGREDVDALAGALRDDGQAVTLLRGRATPVVDRRLARRAYETPLSHLPVLSLELRRCDVEIAHAFHPPDGALAARWARRHRRAAVLTLLEVPDRPWLAARRGRLDSVLATVRAGAQIVVPSLFHADALRRSLGVDARVVGAADPSPERSAREHAQLYRELL
jgi:hypothetical protein